MVVVYTNLITELKYSFRATDSRYKSASLRMSAQTQFNIDLEQSRLGTEGFL